MSSLPNGLTFQVVLTPPSGGNVSALRKQIQSGLGNIQANVQLNNAATANKQINAIGASTKKATRETKSFGDAIGLAGRNFAAYTSAVAIVGRLSIALSRATRDAIKFEREFVKLAQVFDTSVGNLKGLNNEISALSQEYGLSANIIAKTSVVLAQSGLTAKETERALRALTKTTLASTFQNIGLTAEGAIAIIAQFGEGVGALESQLGAVNAVSKKFAVESGDIIEAVRRGGGAFKAANGTFTEFISLFTAVRSTTRESAETISTGFRTIFARLQRPKVIDYFKELNIQLEDGQGNFVGAFEAVKRLSEGLDRAGIKAGQIKFAEVVEQLGGIRQVSRVIPLLGQFTKAEKARQVALAGGASLDADVAKAQETTAQAIERTRQNFAALIREISQTQSFKAIVDIALKMSNAFLEVARTIKPLIPLIAVLGSIKLGGILATAAKTGFTAQGIGSKRPFANGGPVLGFNRGGSVPGSGNGDTVPAMLEPGEFVIRKSAVQAFGKDKLSDINKYARGGKTKGGAFVPDSQRDKQPPLANERFATLGKGGLKREEVSYGEIDGLGLEKPVAGGLKGVLYEKYMRRRFGIAESNGTASFPDVPPTKASLIAKEAGIQAQFNGARLAGAELKYRLTPGTTASYRKGLKGRKDAPANIPMIYAEGARFAKGGSVGTDTVPALLTPGEFVINKKSAQAFGYGGLAKINKYAKGGPVQKFQTGGAVGGAEAGFGFITEAAAQFGVLFFAISQIAGPLKTFQEGLKGGGGAIKKEIDARAQSQRVIDTVASSLQKSLDTLSNGMSILSTDFEKASERVVTTGAATQAVRGKSGIVQAVASGDAKIGRLKTQPIDPKAIAEGARLVKVYQKLEGASGPVISGLREIGDTLRAAGASNQIVAEAGLEYINTIAGADAAFKASQGVVTDLNSEMVSLTNAQKIASNKLEQLNRSTPNKIFDSLKGGIETFGSSIGNAASKLQAIGNTNIGDLTKAAGGKLASGTKSVGRSISAGVTVGARKVGAGIKKAGQAAADNPLAVVAGVAATLRTVVGGISSTYQKIADQAIASGDAEEAATNAKIAAEYKAINDFTTASVGAGAAIGSAFGPLGTIIGSLVGGLVGVLSKFELFQGGIDLAIEALNWLPGVEIETFAGSIEKAEKAARDAANRNKLEKEIEAIGTKFRNLGRDIDPKTNLAGFVSAADELAKVTNQQAISIRQNPIFKEDGKTVDTDEQARRLAENGRAAADAFAAASEAANAQGVSLQQLAQDSPELAKAFKASLPPGEAEAIWNQMIQVNQAAIAAIAAEAAAKQRGIAIFLAQLSIQERLNASLARFDLALARQQDSLANLDFAISGSVGKKEIGSNLTDFDSSGTAKFSEGLREVSRLGPDFANQANQIQGVLQEFAGFSQSLAGGDLKQVSGDISRRLSGILSGPQIDKIREEILNFEGKDDPAAVKALEKKLIEDAIGPFAQTLESGRQKINQSLENYSSLLEKRNTIEQRIYDRRLESLKLEQDINNKIAEIRGDDPSLFRAGKDRIDRGRAALSGTGLGGRLTGNAANDVSFVAAELTTNRNAQKLLQQNINSGRLDAAQQKSARSALQDLGLEATKLETSMQLLSDTTQETAILQKQLDDSREGRKKKGELATELAFGTQESRFNFQQTLGLTKQAVQSGSAEVIPEEKRGDVLSLLKRFEKLPVFGGRTGAEVIKNLTGNFLRNQGFNEGQIEEVLADMVPTEEKILRQIRANLTVDQIRNDLLERIANKLDTDVLAAEPKSTGGPIYASTGKLVNYQPRGTDTVPAMLTPGEFVIKKSSVNKYGEGMLSAINAGNYATGGTVKPEYLAGGGRNAARKKYLEEQNQRTLSDSEKKELANRKPVRQVGRGGASYQEYLARSEEFRLQNEVIGSPRVERARQAQRDRKTQSDKGGSRIPSSKTVNPTKDVVPTQRTEPTRRVLYDPLLDPNLSQAKKDKHKKDLEDDKNRRRSRGSNLISGGRPSTNLMNEMENRQNEAAAEARKQTASASQGAALDAQLGKKQTRTEQLAARAAAAAPAPAAVPAAAQEDEKQGEVFNFGKKLGSAFRGFADRYQTAQREKAGISTPAAVPAAAAPAYDPEAPIDFSTGKFEGPNARRDMIKARSKARAARKNRTDAAKARKAELSGEADSTLDSSTYPSTPGGIYYLKQSFNASNLAKFLKSNLGSNALSYIKAYKDRGINPTKISGDELNTFKESEAQLILQGQPIANKLTLDGAITKNPKLSVLSQDERLFLLWAKNGGITDSANARYPKNISYFKKNLSKIRANFLDLGFQSNPPSLGRDHRNPVGYLNNGGPVGGVPGVDANPAMLTRGEYVINKKSAEAIGTNNLNRLNSAKGYNKGGRVGYYADGGNISANGNSSSSDPYTMFSNSVDKMIGSNGFAMFKKSVDDFSAIPKELTLTVAPTQVTVTLNGAELLSRMAPMIQSQIFDGITSEINTLKADLKAGNIA